VILKADKIAGLLRVGTDDCTADPLVITPSPDLEKLASSGAASVDLRLGTWFSTLRQARVTCLSTEGQAPARQVAKTNYVPFGGKYVLHPRSFVLAVTLEWIRVPSNLASYVVGKSSWGRWGLIIATATGVHPGFKGCLTLELSNVGEIPIEIKPGMPVCQLFIHEVDTGSESVDRSAFVGMRQPLFSRIELDELALRLSRVGRVGRAHDPSGS